jgi:hypothetical protein
MNRSSILTGLNKNFVLIQIFVKKVKCGLLK